MLLFPYERCLFYCNNYSYITRGEANNVGPSFIMKMGFFVRKT
jgi:hypothetical protein